MRQSTDSNQAPARTDEHASQASLKSNTVSRFSQDTDNTKKQRGLTYDDFRDFKRLCANPKESLPPSHPYYSMAPTEVKTAKAAVVEDATVKKRGIKVLSGALSVDPMRRKDSTRDVTEAMHETNELFKIDEFGNRVVNMEKIIDKYINSKEARHASMLQARDLKPIFDKLNPASSMYEALPSSNSCSLGFMNFKRAKLVSPFDEFLYKRYTKIATVAANKKVFTEKPELVEFARPFMPIGNWNGDIEKKAAKKE